MNAKYKNLYQELVSRDMTDLDENSFYNEYSQNDEKFSELYSYLDSNELTDLDPETFKLEYFGTPIIKKKAKSKVRIQIRKLVHRSGYPQRLQGSWSLLYTFFQVILGHYTEKKVTLG